jgi:hypothetical protein
MGEKSAYIYIPPEKPAHANGSDATPLVFVLESPGEIEGEHEFSS